LDVLDVSDELTALEVYIIRFVLFSWTGCTNQSIDSSFFFKCRGRKI